MLLWFEHPNLQIEGHFNLLLQSLYILVSELFVFLKKFFGNLIFPLQIRVSYFDF